MLCGLEPLGPARTIVAGREFDLTDAETGRVLDFIAGIVAARDLGQWECPSAALSCRPMPDPDTLAQVQDAGGAYRRGVAELADDRARELFRDVRRAARDLRRHRHGADGKPLFRGGCTLADRRRQR